METIEREIAETKAEMENVKGTETEIYTRIVGYYRSLANWNKGKRDEYNIRKPFDAQNAGTGRVHERENIAHEKPIKRKSFIPEQPGANPVIAGFTMLRTSDDWDLGERQEGVEEHETCESCQ
jgi:hypothetical protein